jgi:hypothetical protein
MAFGLDPKQLLSFEELLMSQVFSRKPLLDCWYRKEYSLMRSFGDLEDNEPGDG